ncbi:MAG: RNA polymerase sigma factor [Proteobacteria bacterium]|nr:RNA polymerase sigma factor [Pseudomonadota bacterium]
MRGLPKNAIEWHALLKRVRRVTNQSLEAEDVLHTAILRMQEYSQRHAVQNPSAFVVEVARNLSIDDARQRLSRRELMVEGANLEDIADGKAIQDEVLAARARLERVRVALGTLSPRTRTIFLMHRIDGMKYREIAAHFGITMSAVEKHVARAVITLSEFDGDG